jgi:hypothetical protein
MFYVLRNIQRLPSKKWHFWFPGDFQGYFFDEIIQILPPLSVMQGSLKIPVIKTPMQRRNDLPLILYGQYAEMLGKQEY